MPQFRRWDSDLQDTEDNRRFPVVPPPSAPAAPPPEAAPAADFGTFELPSYHGSSSPTYNMPNAPAFNGPQFHAPTFEEAQLDPGYQFRLDAGQKALNRSAAARGVLRTGGTLKDIIEYGQNFGKQEFADVFNRKAQAYGLDYQRAKDQYAPQFAQYQNAAQTEQQRAQAAFNLEFQKYQADLQARLAQEQLINSNLQFGAPTFPGYGG